LDAISKIMEFLVLLVTLILILDDALLFLMDLCFLIFMLYYALSYIYFFIIIHSSLWSASLFFIFILISFVDVIYPFINSILNTNLNVMLNDLQSIY